MVHTRQAASARRPIARLATAAWLLLALWASAMAGHALAGAGAANEPEAPDTDRHHESARPSKVPRVQIGIASVYARLLHGRKTASGEPYDGNELTAAHRTLPLGTMVKVTNLANQRSVVVRINDRGPTLKSRIIDLSPTAGAEIGLRARGKGLARVRLEVLKEEAGQVKNEEKR